MQGFLSVPRPLTLTENTRAFVRRVQTHAQESGRRTPTRLDGLRGLLDADPLDLTTYLLRVIGADAPALTATLASRSQHSDSWFAEASQGFIDRDVGAVARELGHEYIGVEHILLALTRSPGPIGGQLRDAGITWDRVVAAFNAIEWTARPASAG